MKNFLLIALMLVCANMQAQVVLDNSLTVEELIKEVLVSDGVEISNVTFKGNRSRQVAKFTDDIENYGFKEGIYMTTGRSRDLNLPAYQQSDTEINERSNDADLARLLGGVAPTQLQDAAVIEFDFVPNGDSVSFKYAFASEEYPDFVCGDFNDAFGFFLSGPGINGVYSRNAINIALIPNTNIPVTINTVNGGAVGNQVGTPNSNCNLLNNQYYRSNVTKPTIYNGRTVVLEARGKVECGETYHIKLAIADMFDGRYDSGVFLEANSFNSSNVNLDFGGAAFNVNNSSTTEGCDIDLVFSRTEVDTFMKIPVEWGGTATEGADYLGSFDTLYFPIGVDTINSTLKVLLDNIAEGQELIKVRLLTGQCSGVGFEFELNVNDPVPISFVMSDTVDIPCGDSAQLVANLTGGTSNFIYEWTNHLGNVFSTENITPKVAYSEVGDYALQVIDTCVRDTGLFQFHVRQEIRYINAAFTFDNSVFCLGDSIEVTANATDANQYQWLQNATNIGNELQLDWGFNTLGTQDYTLIASDSNDCFVSDTVVLNVNVNDSAFAEFITVEVCPDEQFTLQSVDVTAGNQYNWNISNGTNSNQPSLTTSISTSGSYPTILTVTNAAGCVDEITKTVEIRFVNQVTANFSLPNNRFCTNETFTTNNMSTNSSDYVWYNSIGDTIIGQNANFNFVDTGAYNISVIASSNIACSSIDTFSTPIQIEAVEAAFNVDTLCQNVPFAFNNLNNDKIVTYDWTISGTAVQNSTINPFNTSFAIGGDYTAEVIIISDIGCRDTAQQNFNVQEQPISSFTTDKGCVDVFTTFDNTAQGDVSSVYWDFGDNGSSQAYIPDHIFRDSGNYNVSLVVFSDYCPGDTFTKQVEAIYVPQPNLGDDLLLCVGEDKLLALPFDIADYVDDIVWQDTINSNTYVASTLVPSVKVEVTKSICKLSDELLVFESCNVFAPSAFTPNGDGINDYFNAIPENIDTYTLSVYDRWGVNIFTTSDFNFGWDGTKGGKPLPIDNYIYFIEGVKRDGATFKMSGNVMIMR